VRFLDYRLCRVHRLSSGPSIAGRRSRGCRRRRAYALLRREAERSAARPACPIEPLYRACRDVGGRERLAEIVEAAKPDVIFHLAAQAGVRYSLENPRAYVDSNVTGTFNLLEIVRRNPVQHLIFASTSSIYGANRKMPFVETDPRIIR
jgi:nucleoside-diphosphate-sugar epimerase